MVALREQNVPWEAPHANMLSALKAPRTKSMRHSANGRQQQPDGMESHSPESGRSHGKVKATEEEGPRLSLGADGLRSRFTSTGTHAPFRSAHPIPKRAVGAPRVLCLSSRRPQLRRPTKGTRPAPGLSSSSRFDALYLP